MRKVTRIKQKLLPVLVLAIGLVLTAGCSRDDSRSGDGASMAARIMFLHHSTGQVVWIGNTSKVMSKVFGKSDVKSWIGSYNKKNDTRYEIEEMNFPTTSEGYDWANYPYDYYNIWVKHAGDAPYQGEPTLETLTKKYDVIIWKHCYPVGDILPDTGTPNVDSPEKRLENYKLQYAELKEKMRSFPTTQFIVWTGAAMTEATTSPEDAQRTRQFFDWVKAEWDEPGDNIFLWDFYALETEGGDYLKPEYASGPKDSHPSPDFAGRVAPLFAQRIIDVINGKGDSTSLTGEGD
jgi:hypothetical protein